MQVFPLSTPAAARICCPWQIEAIGLPASAKCRTISITRWLSRRYSGASSAGNDQSVILGRVHGIEIGIEGEVVAAFLAVGLVALKIVDRRANGLARLLSRAHRVDLVPNHQQHLKRHHYLVVLHVVADDIKLAWLP